MKRMTTTRLMILVISLAPACSLFKSPLHPSPPNASIARPCLQTAFGDGMVDPSILSEVRSLGYELARLDLQRVDISSALRQIDEHVSIGLVPLTIIRDAEQLAQLPTPGMYELRNEPDLEGPSPEEYRVLAEAAAAVARDRGQTLYIGSISNLNNRGFDYLHAIRPFPAGVKVSVHRYGDGMFESPHSGFENREREVHWLQAAIGDLPFAVTEFGYPNGDMSEEEAARRIRLEFEFWAGKAEFACQYQLNDGPLNFAIHKFGIYNPYERRWKPQAFVVRGRP